MSPRKAKSKSMASLVASSLRSVDRFSPLSESEPLKIKPRNSLDDEAVAREIITSAMRVCPLSRKQIAEEITRLSGREMTERMLNSYAAGSREDRRFPTQLTRAFCIATGDYRLLTFSAELLGLHVIDETGWELLQLGRSLLLQKQASASVANYRKRLKEVDL